MKRTNFQERSYVTTRYDREQYRKGINIVASGNYQYLKDTQYETLPTVSKKKKKNLVSTLWKHRQLGRSLKPLFWSLFLSHYCWLQL